VFVLGDFKSKYPSKKKAIKPQENQDLIDLTLRSTMNSEKIATR
jgi:hypothetical protein